MVYNAKVISNEILPNSTTRKLVIQRPSDCQYVIQPGAGATLQLNNIARPFSFANKASADEWIFYVRIVEDGEFGRELSMLRANHTIEVIDFFRYFEIGYEHPSYYFATGTGIAPFLCAIESAPSWDDFPDGLFYGAKTAGDLLNRAWLSSEMYTELVVSQQETDTINKGYITDCITSAIIKPDAHYYICGLDQMVNDVSSRLIELGATHDQISVELFYMKNEA